MGKLTVGGEVKSGGSDVFLKPEKTGTIAYLLVDKDGIFSTASQMACFVNGKPPYPCNATWISIGPNDPGFQLRLPGKGYAAWVPVAVNTGSAVAPVWATKIWQTNKTIHSNLVSSSSEEDLLFHRIKIAMVDNRWGVTLLSNPKNKGEMPTKEDFEALVDAIPSEDDLGALLGPDDVQGVREMLMKRLNVQTWKEVLVAFKVPVTDEDDDADVEVESVK